MKIVDPIGEVFYLPGDDTEEAIESFGEDCEVCHGYWHPHDINETANQKED